MRTRTPNRLLTGGAVAAALALATAAPAHASTASVDEPDSFTSAFTVMATPDTVIANDGTAAPGEAGASGSFTFRINSDLDVICYDIRLDGVTGDYQSPAATATHIHEARAGQAGPPRIAFPNPTPVDGDPRTSSGCLQGPFTTGIDSPEGVDTGEGFRLAEIEADPAAFFADTHTASFTAGAVRGQLQQVPVGSIATGAGGAASNGPSAGLVATGAAAAIGALGLAGALAVRSRRTAER